MNRRREIEIESRSSYLRIMSLARRWNMLIKKGFIISYQSEYFMKLCNLEIFFVIDDVIEILLKV
jgi:hypothetical protein